MEYSLDLNQRPFEAIKTGTKKIEGRVPTDHNKHVPFDKLKEGDVINFTNNSNGEVMKTKVLRVTHYKDVREMLTAEGPENVLSSGGNIEEGVESYNQIGTYRENIPKFGIYAIKIEKI